MTNNHILKHWLLIVCLLLGNFNGWATYRLTRVTSVQAGRKYVFERNNRVLEILNDNPVLNTTSKYLTNGLTGRESYVWIVEGTSNAFYLRSMEKGYYLNNLTSTVFSYGEKSSTWKFSFDNGVALIQNAVNNRFIGEKKNDMYSAYSYEDGYLNTCPHDFTIYVLEDEMGPGDVFHETFDVVNSSNTSSFDHDGWLYAGDIYPVGLNGGVRLGKENASGSITTPVLSSLTTDAVLQISVRGYDEDENTLSVSGINCCVEPNQITDITTQNKTYVLQISDVHVNPQITFSSVAGCRIYIDDVRIITHVAVTLASSGYATYCSPHALDLTPTDDYAAYAVSSVSGAIVNFAKIQGRVAPQTPIVLYNPEKAGQTIFLPIATDGETLASNLLRGTLVPTPITTVDGDYTNFGLSGGKFVRINDGTIKANKAYLPLLTSSLPSTSNARLSVTFVDEPAEVNKTNETTGIRAAVASPSCDELYNLQGRRVVRPGKGLYIMRHASGNQQGKNIKVFIK